MHGSEKNEFASSYVVPGEAGFINSWAMTLTSRVRRYAQAEGLEGEGRLNDAVIERLKTKGPGLVPPIETPEWGDFFDTRDQQDIENLPKVLQSGTDASSDSDASSAMKPRDLIVAAAAYQVGRVSAVPMRRGANPATKYGSKWLENMWRSLFTGPQSSLDCPKANPPSGCPGRSVTMSYDERFTPWFSVPNEFFWKTCAPKPLYMKGNGKTTCKLGDKPKERKAGECGEGKVCQNAGAWSWCGLFVAATVKLATADSNIRYLHTFFWIFFFFLQMIC